MAFTDYLSSVQKIFIAYYQRPADPAGLRYWAQRLDSANGDLSEIIDAFANSAESLELYGQINNQTIGTVIDEVYFALFGRSPDTEGRQFYIDGFADGRFTQGTLVLDILNGARNSDAIGISNKLYSAEQFTRFVDGRETTDAQFGVGPYFAVTYSGSQDAVNARNWLDAVTADTSTIPASNETEDFLKNTIADPDDPIFNTNTDPLYSLSADKTTVNEGETLTLHLSTLNVEAGTVIPLSITGISANDLDGAPFLEFVVGQTGSASVSLVISADERTEGGETLLATAAGKSVSILINDTSQSVADPAEPTVYEQLVLEIINFTRAHPTNVASTYDIDLNEGLPAGTITADAKQPLAMNLDIIEAARAHSQWMLDNDLFQHDGANGSKPWDRMEDAGYTNWSTAGENISWRGWRDPSSTAQGNYADGADVVADLYAMSRDLFVDEGIAGRGHRVNLMNASFAEVGVGLITGEFSGYNAIMMTQDFGARSGTTFLLGVAFDDQNGDNFYDIGEGLPDIPITITNTITGQSTQVETFDSGGYQVELADGTYAVVFEYAQERYRGEITIAGQNIKLDLNIDLYA